MASSSLTSLPLEVLWRVFKAQGQHPDLFLACKSLRDARHQYAQAARADDNYIIDLSPLSSLSSLQTLDLRESSGITDLSPLSSLSSLRTFNCSDCNGITEVSP